jgi:hypothetical protein
MRLCSLKGYSDLQRDGRIKSQKYSEIAPKYHRNSPKQRKCDVYVPGYDRCRRYCSRLADVLRRVEVRKLLRLKKSSHVHYLHICTEKAGSLPRRSRCIADSVKSASVCTTSGSHKKRGSRLPAAGLRARLPRRLQAHRKTSLSLRSFLLFSKKTLWKTCARSLSFSKNRRDD